MRSQHADEYNHDPWADDYDEDVLRESEDPIRTGYEEALHWVSEKARAIGPTRVLDLGVGTANLAQRFFPADEAPSSWPSELVGVDVSKVMMGLAAEKLPAPVAERVRFVEADLLEYFDRTQPSFDAVVSTYAIHHLTEPEKAQLFERVAKVLHAGGVFASGDLMFEDESARRQAADHYREQGLTEVGEGIEEEFFWLLDGCRPALERAGFEVEVRRFSELSWGVVGKRRDAR